MSAVAARPFPRLSTLEREGACRIARSLLRDGMDPAMVRRHMMEKRAVEMALPEIQALSPRPVDVVAVPVNTAQERPAAPAFGLKAGHWTPEEDGELRRLHRQGLSRQAIAIALNRAASGVSHRCGVLGLPVQRRKWSEAELAQLASLAVRKTPTQIARQLGRTVQAVNHKLMQLRAEGRV